MIITFSGTGNSLMVARELQKHLGGELLNLTGELLQKPSSQVVEIAETEKQVVWVFPVYSWGVPPVVERFLRRAKVKGAHGVSHFLVCTCGDDTGYTDNQWRKLIGRRGWNPRGSFSVQMPNTYVLMKGFDVDSPELAAAKIAAMPQRVAAIASAINRGFSESDMVRGSMAWLKTYVVYPFFKRFCMSPAPFHSTDACVGCGQCSRTCPMGNITLSPSQRPQWGNRCALCLRCYHICPRHAVAYGKETATKGQKPVIC